jgi:glycosyltransferase involved in cell wall biosynthesis
MKILFFIGALELGGKERRLIELLSYLKKNTDYSLMLVARRDQIDYPAFYELNIPYKILTHNYKKGDKTLHFRFYRICKEYKPNIVHTWGYMPAFVSLLAIIVLKIPLVNSQIADAPPNINKWSVRNIINKINFLFSTIIIANSYAGLKAYKAENKKSKVIYNGVYLDRFSNLPDKNEIRSKYQVFFNLTVTMVAAFYENKDYDLFIEIAKIINFRRNDVAFLAVGNGINLEKIKKRVFDGQIQNVIFTGKIDDVESLVNLADIGVLFSPNGEGISNAIIEYMALGKPVIANDAGGTKEIVKHGVNGYLITTETTKEIADLINNLLDDKKKRQKMGEAGKKLIYKFFTIERMGKEYEKVYQEVAILSLK